MQGHAHVAHCLTYCLPPLSQAALAWAGIALRTYEGSMIESSQRFQLCPPSPDQSALVDTCVQCLRFFNNEMYFNAREIKVRFGAPHNVTMAMC